MTKYRVTMSAEVNAVSPEDAKLYSKRAGWDIDHVEELEAEPITLRAPVAGALYRILANIPFAQLHELVHKRAFCETDQQANAIDNLLILLKMPKDSVASHKMSTLVNVLKP